MSYQKDILSASNIAIGWEILGNSNILITGATGLIGSCLIEVLMSHSNRTYNIYASTRNVKNAQNRFSKFLNDPYFHIIEYNVIERLNCNIHFDYIIHTASGANPSAFIKTPVEVMKANIEGVINLLEYGIAHSMKRMLYISTGEIYGEGDGRVFTEDYSGYVNCNLVRSCYPSSKRAAETLCVSYISEYNADVVIARPCHVYGPHFLKSDDRVYAQFIRNLLNGEDIILKSDGSQFRSWCYVVDCVSALLYILIKGKKGEAYNIADETSNINIKDFAKILADIGNKKLIFDTPSIQEKSGYNKVTKSVFSNEKLKKLGWEINGNMRIKLESTLNECKQLYSNCDQ